MQTLAAGSRNACHAARPAVRATGLGFTLLELLVVMAIVAMVSAGVGFAMRDSSQVQLAREADRLAALLESARAQSRVRGVPVHWRVNATGFQFDGLSRTDLPTQWLDPDTAAVPGVRGAVTLLLGPEPIIGPQAVVLVSRSQPGKSVRLATDGVRPFAVQAALP